MIINKNSYIKFLIAMLIVVGFSPLLGDVHLSFDILLKKYVKDGNVDYIGWKKNSEDIKKIIAYLDSLSKVTVDKLSLNEKKALWINSYNGFTIKAILDNYPIKSIRNIENVWKENVCNLGGKLYSLNEIENSLLRPLGDPRIHFALVCASFSCPGLRRGAFSPGELDQQLNEESFNFFSSTSKGLQVDLDNSTIYVSQILKWYKDDFGTDDSLLLFIAKYSPKEYRNAVINASSVKYIDYNWSLNSQ